MTKYLSAKQKALELGITTSGLAKTRHMQEFKSGLFSGLSRSQI